MMSVHAVEDHPQFISTNRHVMQGYVDLKDCRWRESSGVLSGVAQVVGGDTYEVIIADNGYRPEGYRTRGAECDLEPLQGGHGLWRLSLDREESGPVRWKVKFEE
jgi:hypothetical protein